jgi:hypothetical protein
MHSVLTIILRISQPEDVLLLLPSHAMPDATVNEGTTQCYYTQSPPGPQDSLNDLNTALQTFSCLLGIQSVNHKHLMYTHTVLGAINNITNAHSHIEHVRQLHR